MRPNSKRSETRGQGVEENKDGAQASNRRFFVSSRLSLLASFLPALLLAACATPAPKAWKPLQASELAHPLTLERCLELARANDLKVAQWQARRDAASAELRSAQAIPNPTLELTWEDIGLREAGVGSLAVFKYGVSYPILFWWPRAKEIAAARAGQIAEEHAIRADQRKLAVEIGAAFFTLVADQRKIRISQELLQNARETMRLVKKERELAVSSDYEVNRARADELKAESDLADAQNQLRRDQLSFAFALGADQPMFPQVVDNGSSQSLALFDAAATDSLPELYVTVALNSDPKWARAKAERVKAEAELQLQKRLALPLADTQAGALRVNDPGGKAWDFSLATPIPIFDRNQGGIRRAEAAVRTARADEEEARREVTASLSEIWERGKAAALKWKTFSRELSEIQARNERAAVKLFAAGQISYTDLLQIRRDLNEARLAEVDVWREAAAEHWALTCALGQHDPPTGVSPPEIPAKRPFFRKAGPPAIRQQ